LILDRLRATRHPRPCRSRWRAGYCDRADGDETSGCEQDEPRRPPILTVRWARAQPLSHDTTAVSAATPVTLVHPLSHRHRWGARRWASGGAGVTAWAGRCWMATVTPPPRFSRGQ